MLVRFHRGATLLGQLGVGKFKFSKTFAAFSVVHIDFSGSAGNDEYALLLFLLFLSFFLY